MRTADTVECGKIEFNQAGVRGGKLLADAVKQHLCIFLTAEAKCSFAVVTPAVAAVQLVCGKADIEPEAERNAHFMQPLQKPARAIRPGGLFKIRGRDMFLEPVRIHQIAVECHAVLCPVCKKARQTHSHRLIKLRFACQLIMRAPVAENTAAFRPAPLASEPRDKTCLNAGAFGEAENHVMQQKCLSRLQRLPWALFDRQAAAVQHACERDRQRTGGETVVGCEYRLALTTAAQRFVKAAVFGLHVQKRQRLLRGHGEFLCNGAAARCIAELHLQDAVFIPCAVGHRRF